jgi:predicted ATPase
VAHCALGYTALILGEPEVARSHFEQGVARYQPEQRSFPVYRIGQDPGVACRAYDGLALWLSGYPDQAAARSRDAISLAAELAHPFSRSFALWPATFLHQLRREPAVVRERAEENIALAADQGFALWLAVANILDGWALAVQQEPEAGMERLHQGLATWRTTGANLYVPYFLALVADGHESSGAIEEARRALAEAEALIENTGERWYEAEIFRRKGELLFAGGAANETEAEACFQRAIEIARAQNARSLELRAAISLARLWRDRGRPDDARDLLAPVYAWFTEGFDTADLKDAKVLIDQLRGRRVA